MLIPVLSYLLISCIGCTPKAVLPDFSSDHIKAFSSVKIYANRSKAVNTGVYVDKGDFYSLIATGFVSTSRWDRPAPGYGGSRPERKLDVMINKELQIAPPINATLASPKSGEISLVVDDYGFIPEYGYAKYNNKYYRDNRGSFETTVIVWNTKEVDKIIDFFNDFESLNPESEIGEKLIVQAESLKESLAEAQLVSSSVDTPHPEQAPLNTTSSAKPVVSDGQQSESVSSITNKHSPQPLQTVDESAKIVQGSEDRYAPLMLLLSPREGQITSTSTIQLIGVIEDDTALQKIDITVNGTPIALQGDRGIILNPVERATRIEFNEKIPIVLGPNRIKIRAEDVQGRGI